MRVTESYPLQTSPARGDTADKVATGEAHELDLAISSGQVVVHYEPKVELSTDRVVAVEALVRWEHPERGVIFPDEFIPLAERTGLIRRIDWLVLDSAARQHAVWQSQGHDLPVGVNLSPVALLDPELPARVSALCIKHAIRPRGLELEITESAVIENPAAAAATLDDLVRRGFVIALDDFGTGYSSLSHLRELPVSVVKIDKSFVLNMDRNDHDARIVRGTIELARGVGKHVVAEGVENADVAKLLLLMGCHHGQGYHWTPALPPTQFDEWLATDGVNVQPADTVVDTPTPIDEAARLSQLRRYRILDTAYDAVFDEIAEAAAQVCGVPISAVSLIDADRQWFKAHVGLDVRETSRRASFCTHLIMDPTAVMVVPDALNDARFVNNALITGEPSIRFYAGAPLVAPTGLAIGSLCVIDRIPRHLTNCQLDTLRDLSRHVIALLEARQYLAELEPMDPSHGIRLGSAAG